MSKKLSFIFLYIIIKVITFGDIQIIQDVKTEEIDPKSGIRSIQNTEQIKWIKGNNIVNINGHFTTILNLSEKKEKNRIVFIDNKKKEFFKTSFPIYFSRLLPKELMAVRISQIPKVKMKKLNSEEKIGKYNCKMYKITLNFLMMMIKIKVWASEEPFNGSFLSENSSLHLNSSFLLKYFYPDLPDEKKIRRFDKVLQRIKGIQIKSVVEMDLLVRKIIITTELKNISNQNAPAGIFSIPKNYKEGIIFQN